MINYKVELSVLRQRLPTPFRPRSIHGYGMAGFCMFRVAPRGLQRRPSLILVHRLEAEAVFPGYVVPGTYVVRWDVAYGLGSRPWGSFFPNLMHSSRLRWRAEAAEHSLEIGPRQHPWLSVRGHQSERFPLDSIMERLDIASRYFQVSQSWFAPRYGQTLFEQRRWDFEPWRAQPLLIDALDAPQFQAIMDFPRGASYFDHALILHNLNYRYDPPVELIAPRPIRLLFDE